MKKIPLKTLLKAQKKLQASTTTRRSKDNPADHGGVEPPHKSRRGREAPRREMDPDLLKAKGEVNDASELRKKRKKQSRDNKHA